MFLQVAGLPERDVTPRLQIILADLDKAPQFLILLAQNLEPGADHVIGSAVGTGLQLLFDEGSIFVVQMDVSHADLLLFSSSPSGSAFQDARSNFLVGFAIGAIVAVAEAGE